MNRIVLLYASLGASALLVLSGCSSSTRLTTVWSDPVSRPGTLHKLMVIDVAKSPTIRRAFEDRFAAALKARGIEAQPSYGLVGDATLDSAQVSMEMHNGHCDGVLVTRVMDQKMVRTYYPPTSAYRRVPAAYHGGWYSYYSAGYGYLTTPGYTVEKQLVNMETNLYRVSDGVLVWSALSRTWLEEAETPGEEINPVVQQLVRGLAGSAVIARRGK